MIAGNTDRPKATNSNKTVAVRPTDKPCRTSQSRIGQVAIAIMRPEQNPGYEGAQDERDTN